MIAKSLLVALAMLTTFSPTALVAQDRALPPYATAPDWLSKPSPADVERFYPKLAAELGIGGFVTLGCRVNSRGFVEQCRIISQSPPAMGFGGGALGIAPLFRFRPAVALAGAIPSIVNIPVRFVPPEDDLRKAIPFAALAAVIATLAARRRRRTRIAAQATAESRRS